MTLAVETKNLHPSTEIVLALLQRLHARENVANILDIGCGNGILSIVTANLWPTTVLAADISQQAVDDATRAVAEAGLTDRITVLRSEGFSNPELKKRAPYGLILANLLAETLLDLAPSIKESISPNGYCIIAGILAWKAEETKKAYMDLGFEMIEEMVNSPWHGMLLRQIVI